MNDTHQFHSLNICFYFFFKKWFPGNIQYQKCSKIYVETFEMDKSSMHYDPQKKCQVLQCLNEY